VCCNVYTGNPRHVVQCVAQFVAVCTKVLQYVAVRVQVFLVM